MDRNPVPWWASALVAALVLLLVLQPTSGRKVEDLGSQVLSPFSSGLTGIVRSISDNFSSLQNLGSMRETNRQQSEEIDKLNFELVRMKELEQENADLRRMLGFKESNPNLHLLPVRILGSDATGIVNAITIDKGSNDGIQEDTAVITWKGLAGRVIQVRPNNSTVLLISDVSSSVAVRVQDPTSRASGVVSGRKEGGLIMRHILQQELIQNGDQIITSGVGGFLPEGLPIGKVVRVQKRNIEMFQEAVLESAVDTTKLERLYAILDYPKKQ